MKWWHSDLSKRSSQVSRSKGSEPRERTKDTEGEVSGKKGWLESRDSKLQQHQGENKPPYGHWCTLVAYEGVSPACWPSTTAGISRDMGGEGSLAHQAPECSNLTTRGGSRAKVDLHPEPGFFPETRCPEERGKVFPFLAPHSLEGLMCPCDL